MHDVESLPEKLPFGVLQCVILTLEEIRDQAIQGKKSAQLQIAHTQRLQAEDRERIMPVVKGQLNYWQTCEKAINWIIHRAGQRLRWPARFRTMTRDELTQLGFDETLREAMQWNKEEELTPISKKRELLEFTFPGT